MVNKKNKKIICLALANGRKHDFRIFKDSRTMINPTIQVVTDSGYQGIKKIHSHSKHPKKRSKKSPLTKQDKAQNKEISQARILNENVIGLIKRFKIISDRYRNRRKHFGLRCNLIAGIHNYEI